MTVLPDYLERGLRVVFCGTAPSLTSAQQHHYYARPGNKFWLFLYESGLLSEPLTWAEDARVLEFGLGLTDIAKHVAASSDAGLSEHYDVEGFEAKMAQSRPQWVAFHGKEAAKVVSKHLRQGRKVKLGRQPWTVAGLPVFVLPSASSSNQDAKRLEGHSTRVDWFRELAELAA